VVARAVSATIANGAGAQVATVPAGSYYLTAAGGVSSFLTALQSALNQATPPAPTTAATLAAAIGYGTWTSGAGWMCNEASGNLAASFGAPTLTATSLTYQNAGYTTGDYAIGFSGVTSRADGGDVYDVTAAQDLIVAWIGNMSGIPSTNPAAIISKYGVSAGNGGWSIQASGVDGSITFIATNTTPAIDFQTASVTPTFGSWHVGIAVIDRSTGKARIGVRSLAGVTALSAEVTANAVSYAGNAALRLGQRSDSIDACTTMKLSAAYVVSGAGVATGLSANLSTALTNFANAVNAAWTVSLDAQNTGRVSIGWSGYTTPTFSLAFTNTTVRDIVGFAADITAVTTTQTGTKQARGLWLPAAPFDLRGDAYQAPPVSDLRQQETPGKQVLALVGNYGYRHKNVVYAAVQSTQVWESYVTYANASWEYFFKETQLGLGSSWFVPSSPVQIYYPNAAGTDLRVGQAANISGWFIKGLDSIEPEKTQASYTGLYRIELPEIVSNG
jgi:hypothetical protein